MYIIWVSAQLTLYQANFKLSSPLVCWAAWADHDNNMITQQYNKPIYYV